MTIAVDLGSKETKLTNNCFYMPVLKKKYCCIVMGLVFVYPSVINFVSAETLWIVLDTMILGGIFYMGLAARKPVFGVSTETSYKVAILLVASSDMKLSIITKALITV